MTYCHFVATDQPNYHRCTQCGFVLGPVRAAASRCVRVCSANTIDLNAAADSGEPGGLGDVVANWAAPFARMLRLADCGGCKRRQAKLNRLVPAKWVNAAYAKSLLLRFPHGFGDCVQFTLTLAHLRKYAPDWTFAIASRPGTQSLFRGVTHAQYVLGEEPAKTYSLSRTIDWHEPSVVYGDSPSTKVERCLREVFSIQPDLSLCGYHFKPSWRARRRAGRYVAQIGKPIACIHYQGGTSRHRKDLPDDVIRPLLDMLHDRGIAPVLLDWADQSALRKERHVYCPGGGHWLWDHKDHADADVLAALLSRSMLNIGIDSGPGHLMGAINRPTIITWRKNHPLHYYSHASHVTHLVPPNHEKLLCPGDTAAALEYMRRHYDCRIYQNLTETLVNTAVDLIEQGPLTLHGDCWVRRQYLEPDLIIVRDVYLEDCYRTREITNPPKYVVDVGAHVGTFARLARQRWPGVNVACVEAHPANLPALRANTGDFAQIIPAACSYLHNNVTLLSSIFAGSGNTGASRVVATTPPTIPAGYAKRTLTVNAITLEALLDQLQWPQIDMLKLDCEGSEEDILTHADLDRLGVRHIVGEWHDRERFLRLVERRFDTWRLRIIKDDVRGLFWLWR